MHVIVLIGVNDLVLQLSALTFAKLEAHPSSSTGFGGPFGVFASSLVIVCQKADKNGC